MKKNPEKRLAFSYVRMSTEKQIKGDSLRRQLEWGQSYATANELQLDDSLRDIGVSAWRGDNRKKGALGEFLRMVRESRIPNGSFLLVESLDRLSRSQVMDALELVTGILRAGITIVTMGPPEQVYTWDGINGDFGQLIITLTIMARAHEESERKSQRIRAAFENKRKLSRNGIKTNQTPPHWIDATPIGKGQFEYLLNDRAPLVQWIFERSADGVGFDRIARELNERGQATPKPSKRGWWYTSIANIITNRSAIGEYQPYEGVDGVRIARGDPIADYYPAVVTNDLWLRAQKIVHRNRKGGRAGTAFSNLFSNMAFCSHCQSAMHMISNSRSEKQWSYLVCSANHRKQMRDIAGKLVPICEGDRYRFRYKNVEKFVLDNVTEFGVSDLLLIKRTDEELQALNEQHADCVIKLEDLRRREERLLAFAEADEAGEIPAILAQMGKRKLEREEAEQRLQHLQHAIAVARAKQTALDPVSAIHSMRERWETTEDEGERYGLRVRCNRAMRDFIDYVTFDGSDGSFMVILFGGLRAYKFTNPKFARNSKKFQSGALSQQPVVVDMTRFAHDQPHQYPEYARLIASPIDPKQQLKNDIRRRGLSPNSLPVDVVSIRQHEKKP